MYETPTRQPLIQTHMAKKHTHTHTLWELIKLTKTHVKSTSLKLPPKHNYVKEVKNKKNKKNLIWKSYIAIGT